MYTHVHFYLEPLRYICDSDVIVSLCEETSLQLTGFIHIIDAGFLLGLAQSPPPSPLTPSLLLLLTFFLLLLLTTQILDTNRQKYSLGKIQILNPSKNW